MYFQVWTLKTNYIIATSMSLKSSFRHIFICKFSIAFHYSIGKTMVDFEKLQVIRLKPYTIFFLSCQQSLSYYFFKSIDDQFDDLVIIGSLKRSYFVGHSALYSQVCAGLDDSGGQTLWSASAEMFFRNRGRNSIKQKRPSLT